MTISPAVSVLVRTLGRREALKDALASLRAQNMRDFEVVIVEDGPATLAPFLASYGDLPIRHEALGMQQGRVAAGNRALALARGEHFIFLDEDDAFAPDHLGNLLQKARQGRRIVYSRSREYGCKRAADGRIIKTGRFVRTRRETFSLPSLLAYNFIPINAVLFHRSLYEQGGGFDADVDLLEDWLLWLRYAALEPDWACVPQATAIYSVPLDRRARRHEFHGAYDTIGAHLEKIRAGLPRDLKQMSAAAVFLRKLYYYLTSYI